MPILTLQRQLRELGRIRIGVQEEFVKDGKKKHRPAKLDTFRITSEARELVEAAAVAYGGIVRPWQNGEHAEFEVVTETTILDIIIPPGQPVSQWFEMWSGGGCQRRCDGVTNVLTMTPCACPADTQERRDLAKRGEACKETTRLNVMLPALPDLGVFRLESHGYYAAVELAGAAEILVMASARNILIPARLRLEQREKKVPGKPTNRYAVPIIEFVGTKMADLELTDGAGRRPALGSGRPAVPALPATTLPPASDFRAPLVERPESEPDRGVAPSATPEARAAARPVAPQARALCGDPSPYGGDESCNLLAGHLDDPRAPRMHRVLDGNGGASATWPAG